MKKLFIATPTTGTIADSQTYVLRELQERYKDSIEFVYPKQCVRRIFHDFARNSMVEEFLDSDCDAIWFLDSDISPAKHVLDLVSVYWNDWSLAGAPYPVFMCTPGSKDPQVVFTVYKNEGHGLSPAHIPYTGQEMVQGIATGCLFIKREVFSKLSKPYFEFKYNPETREVIEGEDLGFCRKVGEQGYQFLVDYSMTCKHYKQVCLLEVNNYAITYANNSVLAYDAQIKEQVTKSIKAAYNRGRLEAAQAPQPPKSGLILPKHLGA